MHADLLSKMVSMIYLDGSRWSYKTSAVGRHSRGIFHTDDFGTGLLSCRIAYTEARLLQSLGYYY